MKKNKILPSATVVFVAVLLLLQASRVRTAVTQSMTDALNKVIPGLFPMLVLSGYSCRTGLLCPQGKRTHRLCVKFAGISVEAFPVVLYGLTAGYPTGIKTAYSLYETGILDAAQMQKLSAFCMSPGLAFSVLTVGNGLYGNTKTGWILFFSCTAACICTGLLCGRFHKKEIAYRSGKRSTEPSVSAFTQAVGKASESIVSVCAWMAFCAAMTACAERILPGKIMSFWNILCEVTVACSSLRTAKPLPYTAAAMGLGGVCVWLQVLPELQKSGCNIGLFIGARFLCAVLSGLFCRLLCILFPFAVNVVCVGESVQITSKTPIFSFFLIFTCIIFIIDLAQREKMWYTYFIGDKNEAETMG